MNESDERRPTSLSDQQPPLPEGYRQGIITATTVLLGISLAFFRFWGFEAAGVWSSGSIIAAATLAIAIALQIVALVRSLRLEDNTPGEYRKTVKWFVASAIVLLVGLSIAVVVFSFGPNLN
jgi:hypothetical protein